MKERQQCVRSFSSCFGRPLQPYTATLLCGSMFSGFNKAPRLQCLQFTLTLCCLCLPYHHLTFAHCVAGAPHTNEILRAKANAAPGERLVLEGSFFTSFILNASCDC